MTFARPTFAAALALAALSPVSALSAPAASAKVSAGFSARVLSIEGGEGNDRAVVRCTAAGDVKVNGKNPKQGSVGCDEVVEIDAAMGRGDDLVDASGVGPEFGRAQFGGFGLGTGVAALLGAGEDRYVAGPTAFNLVYGHAGEDRLNGGRERDIIVGGAGEDAINCGAGRDTAYGNGGGDRVLGGAGADVLSGNAADDLLLGGAGADILGGGTGADRLRGGQGPDKLFGGAGRDSLRGGAGKNKLVQDPG